MNGAQKNLTQGLLNDIRHNIKEFGERRACLNYVDNEAKLGAYIYDIAGDLLDNGSRDGDVITVDYRKITNDCLIPIRKPTVKSPNFGLIGLMPNQALMLSRVNPDMTVTQLVHQLEKDILITLLTEAMLSCSEIISPNPSCKFIYKITCTRDKSMDIMMLLI